MKTSSTETFSITLPDIYGNIRVAWESIQAEHTDDTEEENILSFIKTGLYETAYFDQYKGGSFAERFYSSCEERRGIVEALEDKTFQVGGNTAYVRLAQSAEGYFYYFGAVEINGGYCYDFTGDCLLPSRGAYEKIFEEALQSLQFFGNPKEALAKQRAGVEALFAKMQGNRPEEAPKQTLPEIKPFSVPANGQEVWRIDDKDIEFLPETSFFVSPADRCFYIDLKGVASNYDKDAHAHILNDYEDGQVYLRAYFREVYNAGVPQGAFKLAQGRDNTFKCSLWKGGFHYSLDLTGTFTFADGWVGFSGYFENIMQTVAYPVTIAKKIPLENLDWTNYRFSSLAEAATAPSATVQHLQLQDPDPAALEGELGAFTQMKTFGMNLSAGEDKGFTEIPRHIKKFRQLTELDLHGLSEVTHIPNWIGELKALKKLAISNSKVEGIHPQVFSLPALEFCYLSHNRLGSVTPAITDSIKVLSLENNRLTTVPESLARLPNLKHLNIRKNPLEHLPDGLDQIENLDLESEKRHVLLDYTYKGAGGTGVVTYNDNLFHAKDNPALMQTLHQAAAAAGLREFEQPLRPFALKAVALQTTEADDYSAKGNTRFGGLPDLPPELGYPTFVTYHGDTKGLQFIAQLNCTALAPFQDYLPRTGMLYFFIEDQQQMGARVIYNNSSPAQLQSAATLDITEDFIYDDNGIYKPYKAEAGTYVSLPFFYNDMHLYRDTAPELAALEDGKYNETEKLRELLDQAGVKPVHSINSYVFKQHGSPQLEASDKLKGKPGEWMVLLRVSSDNNTGFSFWDAGEIYFVIHKSDLAKGDFSNVYCGLESS